jgi:hypothetical protein
MPDVAESLLSPVPSDAEIRGESTRLQVLCDPDYSPVPSYVFRGGDGKQFYGTARRGEQVMFAFPHRCPRVFVAATIAHEVAHLICEEHGHGDAWRAVYLRVLREAYGLELDAWPDGGDEAIEDLLRASGC